MRRINKGGLALALALSAAPIAIMPAPASAQMAVVDVKAIAQAVKQVTTQAQMLQQQIQQYQNMIVNTASLPAQEWGQAMQSINSVNNLLRQAQSLAYQSGNIEQQIRQRYQGYNAYANGSGVSMADKYNQWSNETNSSVASTLSALGLQSNQMQDEDALMRRLESMGNTAEGRMQAAQVGNQLAAQAVRQTMQLRQLQMMQLQMQANWMAQQQDREALLSANGQKAYTHQQQSTTGGAGLSYTRQ